MLTAYGNCLSYRVINVVAISAATINIQCMNCVGYKSSREPSSRQLH